MKLKHLTLSLCFIFMAAFASGQDKEVGIMIGAAQYQGDLSLKQVTFPATKLGVGAFFRYYFNPRVDIKAGLQYGTIEGNDDNYPDVEDRMRRNFSFKSRVIELSAVLEYNILPFISNSQRYRFAPYVFGGAAIFNFNPKAEYQGNWYALQPLGTEGQNLGGEYPKPYSLIQFAIPYGFGFKYSLGKFWNLGLEVGQRKLFTDYLDDVSGAYPDQTALAANNPMSANLSYRTTEVDPDGRWKEPAVGQMRGDPDDLDMYIFAGITISKTFRRFPCTDF
ncbi:MAG: DUF6089 family protein [Bacteroidota bacterium]|nr:DUF6089 family protein [Bacteroidota bacterium]